MGVVIVVVVVAVLTVVGVVVVAVVVEVVEGAGMISVMAVNILHSGSTRWQTIKEMVN